MATYDLAYPGAAIDAILNTAYFLQEAGYIFQGSASEYSGTPSKRVWLIAPAGFSGYGFSSAIPKGSIGICKWNGSAWSGDVINVVTIDNYPTHGSTNAVTSGGMWNALDDLGDGIWATLQSFVIQNGTASANQGTQIKFDVKMTDGQQVQHLISSFGILAATTTKAGLMSAADKAKVDAFLDNLRSLSFTDTTPGADVDTKIVETLKMTVDGVQEAVTALTILAATTSKAGLMSATDKAYIDGLPTSLSTISTSISKLLAMLGYYECSTAAATAAKEVSASGYVLTTGGCIRIKMANANTAANVTLNINSTGAKALYYDGAQASSSNSWEAGEVLEVYYDGTQYQCASGGGGKFASGENVKEVSIANNIVDSNSSIPSSKIFYDMMKGTVEEITSKEITQANNTLQTITLVGGRTYTFVVKSATSATISTWNFYLRDVTASVDLYTNNKSNITADSGQTYTYTCPANRDGHTCNIGLFTSYRNVVTLNIQYLEIFNFFNKAEVDRQPTPNSHNLVESGDLYTALQGYIPMSEMTAWFASSVSKSISNRGNVTFFSFTPDKVGQKYVFVFSSDAAVGGTKFNIWIYAAGSGDVFNKNMSSLPANTDVVVEYNAISTAAHGIGVYMEGTAGTVNLDIAIENVDRQIALLSDLGDEANTYDNPVIHNDSPDPTVYQDEFGNYYFLSTKNTNSSVNAAPYTSRDCIHWEAHNDVLFDAESLSTLTGFATALWAPQVIKIGDLYTMYLAVHKSNHNSRIAVLQSKLPTGLFKFKTWLIDSSLVNDTDQIDACPVYDRDGNLWLAFGGGVLYIVKMGDDGLSIDPSTLKHIAGVRGLSYGASGYQEGAYIYYRNGYYYLFGAGGDYANSTYNIQVARSESIDGTYLNKDGVDVTTAAGTIIMQSSGTLYGSGHNGEIIKDRNNKTHMFYHAHWTGGSSTSARFTCIQEILWDENGWPYFEDGSAKLSCKTFMV